MFLKLFWTKKKTNSQKNSGKINELEQVPADMKIFYNVRVIKVESC